MSVHIMDALSHSKEISPYLKKDPIGRIKSVFSRAVNILAENNGSDFLITIIDKDMGSIPYGILVDLQDKINFYNLGLKEDMQVKRKGHFIVIPEAKVLISTKGAKVFTCASKPLESILYKEEIIGNLNIINNVIKTKNLASGLSPLFDYQQNILDGRGNIHLAKLDNLCKYSFTLLKNLMQNIKANNVSGAKEDIENFIGLGIGLTPSADDVLVGFIGVFIYLKNYLKKTKYFNLILELLKSISSIASSKTTLVSQIYLKAAAEGKLSEFLSDFIKAILTSYSIDKIKFCTDRLLSIGSSSGKEIVLGVSLGVKFFFELLNLNRSDFKNVYKKSIN